MAPKGLKRGFLALTDEEKDKPLKLVKHAESMPAVVKSDDKGKDEDLSMIRDDFMVLVSGLWRNPSYVKGANHWLQNRLKSDEMVETHTHFKTVSTLSKLDEHWACGWLVANSMLTMSGLEMACSKDTDAWRHLLIMALKSLLSVKVPEECREKDVLNKTLKIRLDALGNRLREVSDEYFVLNDQPNWKLCGVYCPLFGASDAKAELMLHRPTADRAAIPGHIHITKEFKIWSNWDDMEAVAVHSSGVGKHTCHEMFAKDKGPFKHSTWKGAEKEFAEMPKEAKRTIRVAQEAATQAAPAPVVTPTKFNQKAKEENARKSMNAARRALSQKKESLANSRCVDLS